MKSTANIMPKLEPFTGEGGQEWEEYVEIVDQFFIANNIVADKQRAVFLSSCGRPTYSLLRRLLAPIRPSEAPLARCLELLTEHYSPRPSVIVQRYHFYCRTQDIGETVKEFVAGLRQLADRCEFGAELANNLRDRIVHGIRNDVMRRRLLEEPNLTLDRAVELITSMEAAARGAEQITGRASGTAETAVNRVTAPSTSAQSAEERRSCFRCGGKHRESTCKFVNSVCFKCRQRGHISRLCQNKTSHEGRVSSNDKHREGKTKQTLNSTQTPANRSVHVMQAQDSEESDSSVVGDLWPLNPSEKIALPGNGRKEAPEFKDPPIFAEVTIQGKTVQMELDTGAVFSVMDETEFERRFPDTVIEPSTVKLRGYFGQLAAVVGKATVMAEFGGKAELLPLFVVRGGSRALLGRNWARAFNMPLDQLVNVHQVSSTEELAGRFHSVFSEGLGTLKGMKATISVPEGTRPRFFRPRTVPFALQDLVAQELQRLQRDGILTPVRTSEWAAPIVPVLKKDGRIRICGDFKLTVNQVAITEVYPVPRLEEMWAKLAGGTTFSKLDLRDAYQQIELEPAVKKFVTINTQKGLFQYNRLPFGVASAPAIFQREMENLLRDCNGTIVYFDDILVTGATENDHCQNLEAVLKKLSEAGLKLKLAKCSLFQRSVEYLGHIIDAEGIHPAPKKIEAVIEAPEPSNVKELQSYLGLLNFYRKFMPNVSSVLHPLHKLLKKGEAWSWGAEELAAFNTSKAMLTSASVLVYYDPSQPVVLCCDASPYGVGAVLAHRTSSGEERPIAFASRRLTAAEKNYSQLDKEALAVIYGVTKFNQFLWGRQFDICTDHKPLLGLLGHDRGIPQQCSPRVLRWALTLSAYCYRLVYRPGVNLGNADGLSRLPLPGSSFKDHAAGEVFMLEKAFPSLLSAAAVAQATNKDPIVSTVREALWSGKRLPESADWRTFSCRLEEFSVQDGCVLWGCRIVVPTSLRPAVLSVLHETHPGIEKMKMVARSHVWWPGIDEAIENKVNGCTICQVHRRAPRSVQQTPWPFPENAWSRLHVDFGGPFQGIYFLVLVDAFSKWVEVHRVPSPSAKATVECLRSIFATHGLPDVVVSNNGLAFVSAEFKDFLARNGVRAITIPPYHPASNGAAERVVQTIKEKLKKAKPGCFEVKILEFFLITERRRIT